VDTRTDDFIGEVDVRSDDSSETKSFELHANHFKVNGDTGEVEFAEGVWEDIQEHVRSAVMLVAHHELEAQPDAAS
jgi:hypothetical protein